LSSSLLDALLEKLPILEQQSEHEYLYTTVINGTEYGLTGEEVLFKQIGNQIGKKPISCHNSECAPPPPGDTFFEIVGVNIKEAVALQVLVRNEYIRCDKIDHGPLR